MNRLTRPIAAVVAFAAIGTTRPATAGLTTVDIVSGQNQADAKIKGKFSGEIKYDSATAQLTITLNNLNTAADGGYLVALAFNNPGDQITKATIASKTNSNFFLYGTGEVVPPKKKGDPSTTKGNNTVKASPYADFDFLLGLGDDFEGAGGKPQNGIGTAAPKNTATFVINLTGNGLGGLTASSFLGAYNSTTEKVAFLARFKGFNSPGDSDKVTGVQKPPPVTAAVPEPSLTAMGAAGLAGLFGLRRRFTKSV